MIPLLLWFGWAEDPTRPTLRGWWPPVIAFSLALSIAGVMLLWARLVLRARYSADLAARSRRFHIAQFAARVLNVVLYGFCLFSYSYGNWVESLLNAVHLDLQAYRLPGVILGTAPVLLGWVGLMLAAYPVERAAREQNLLILIDNALPAHTPPGWAGNLWSGFRMQVLFTVAPLLCVIVLRDVAAMILRATHQPMTPVIEGALFAASLVTVFVIAPAVLVRVLGTQPLADSPLRTSLQSIGARLGVRCRKILVWDTNYAVGNAMMMGIIPRFRYILLSDLLIESLSTRQIQAVFAHEAGHAKHRHLAWYLVFFAIFSLTLSGPASALMDVLVKIPALRQWPLDLLVSVFFIGGFVLLFGMLARLFEKQADLFAGRAMEMLEHSSATNSSSHSVADSSRQHPGSPGHGLLSPLTHAVGPGGAEAISSALLRVADINQMPLRSLRGRGSWVGVIARHIGHLATNFLHPSIMDRVEHLRFRSRDPCLTAEFDRSVLLVQLAMLVCLLLLCGWTAFDWMRPG